MCPQGRSRGQERPRGLHLRYLYYVISYIILYDTYTVLVPSRPHNFIPLLLWTQTK